MCTALASGLQLKVYDARVQTTRPARDIWTHEKSIIARTTINSQPTSLVYNRLSNCSATARQTRHLLSRERRRQSIFLSSIDHPIAARRQVYPYASERHCRSKTVCHISTSYLTRSSVYLPWSFTLSKDLMTFYALKRMSFCINPNGG